MEIWADNWIPKEMTPRPITSLVADPPKYVSELILPATASWNEDLVRAVFLPIDAEAILRIPVCTRNIEDFLAWYPETKGKFTVNSAYRFLQQTKIQREEWFGRKGRPAPIEMKNRGACCGRSRFLRR